MYFRNLAGNRELHLQKRGAAWVIVETTAEGAVLLKSGKYHSQREAERDFRLLGDDMGFRRIWR